MWRGSPTPMALCSQSGTTDASWSTRRAGGVINMMFKDDELDLEDEPVFTVQADFDFYVLDDRIFIKSKPRFEALLSYKAGHERVFQELTAEPEFAAVFADTGPSHCSLALTRFTFAAQSRSSRRDTTRTDIHVPAPGGMREYESEHRLRRRG